MNSTIVLQEPEVAYGDTQLTTVAQPKEITLSGGDSSIYLSKSRYFPQTIATLLQKLNRLARLGENWDGYGAAAPSDDTIRAATDFIIRHYALDLPFYFSAPGVNGEIMLEMSRGNRAAELYFLADGTTELILFKNNETELEGNLEENISKLLHFFDE